MTCLLATGVGQQRLFAHVRQRFQSRQLARGLSHLAAIISLFIGFALEPPIIWAEEFLAEFEGPETSWKVMIDPRLSKVPQHQRRRDAGKVGSAEFIRINSIRENPPVRLEHAVPAATVLDELEVSVWVKSNHDGLSLEAKITLPEILDPETKVPLTLQVTGDTYQTPNRWQQLKCRTSDKAISAKIRVLRAARKEMSINPRSLYVDRIALTGRLPPGETDVFLDNLSVEPLVRFEIPEEENETQPIQRVNQSVQDSNDARTGNDARSNLPVQFRLHRLQVEGKPFFPRIITYHHERPDVLQEAGINVAWVEDYENTSVTSPLRRQGLWVTSAPPYAKGIEGEPLDSDDASLLPFQSNTAPVLFWMLGARLSPEARPRLTSWANQIRNADRRFNKRPIAADVVENERLCSRHVDLLGISRHVIHTNCSLSDYRDWIIQRRDQALPDTFCWTWIQTEPVPSLLDLTRRAESPPMLEPEQIRLQVYAALAAGCRGLGYWTTTPLDDNSPAGRERLLVLTQLNLELDLFEPWITSGGVPQLVSFKVDAARTDQQTSADKSSASKSANQGKNTRLDSTNATAKAAKKPERELHAALIRSEQGALLLPMWLEDGAQFVPGPMAARNVTIIVPVGGGETAHAWEMSTTGQLRHLERELVAGGVQIKLPRLDQTAAVLITTNYSTVEELNQRIREIQEQSAHLQVDLAKLKLERIRIVDQSLQDMGIEQRNGWQLLGEAKINLDKAETALRSQQYAEARKFAAEAMLFGRLLQRSHWEHAVKRLPTATANPWAVSFQSLPEYWRLSRQIESFGSLETLENLLPSAEFEDRSTLIAEHWKHEQLLVETIESGAELYGSAKQGKFCLRLSARPVEVNSVPTLIPKPPVTMISPGIVVHAGQTVRISGWAKIPANLVGSTDGALIYDSLLGKPGAIRLKGAQDWKKFELIRPVPESQEMTLTIALHGLGELLIDDVQVTAFEPAQPIAAPTPNKSAVAPTKYSPLDLRRLNPLPKKK